MRGAALPLALLCAAAIGALQGQSASAQADPPASQATPRGENFSAKPAPALFASDCTGAGCHKGPQGLGKRFGLTSFLREHYTNSRESAAALASYLASIPASAERATPPGRASRAAARADDDAPGSTAAPGQRSRRTAAPAAAPAVDPPEPATPAAPGARGRRTAEPAEIPPKPARGQRGRQATAAPAAVPSPEPPPETPAEAPTPPPAQVFDIFD